MQFCLPLQLLSDVFPCVRFIWGKCHRCQYTALQLEVAGHVMARDGHVAAFAKIICPDIGCHGNINFRHDALDFLNEFSPLFTCDHLAFPRNRAGLR